MSELRNEPFFSDAEVVDDAPRPRRRASRRRRTPVVLGALLAALAVVALVSVLWQPDVADTPAPPRAAPGAPVATQSAAAPARYPIVPTPGPQPPLDASDAVLAASLAAVFGDGAYAAYVEPASLVRRVVATVDNLPRRSASPALWPVKPAAGSFAVRGEDGRLVMADANAYRYVPYVRLLASVDTAKLVALYRRHYPLFQQAYAELGFPERNFNDRAVEAIDVLVATPTLDGPLRLAQPKVVFVYADRDLEQLPAGQKLMLRLGADNAARVKAKLVELRAALADSTLQR